ncbi:hypothetical protein GFJ94_07360 [Flavobacterium sp. LMO8]|uniref:DUF5687 family protein n=1 Tax=Flavobacterium sp. LMO8 TaxID=2654244 RepID=UPI001292B7AB|nr:DUF5687 family protein [Flavobacterium sp. LMO8]MDP5027909.1 DUF5687 family protein [Flavobacterium sp.]MQP24881.1 hypothetical protein [Flavobacterium sp. LMO8]
MIKHFLTLEWKSFVRSASFKTNLAFKIFMALLFLYFASMFVLAGFGAFYGLKKAGLEPLQTVNKFIIYYLFADMMMRYFFQKIPTLTIRPLLVLPIKKNTIVHFSLGKTVLNYFNTTHAFFFIPFSIILLYNDYNILGVISWHLGILTSILFINFLNILINNKDLLFGIVATIIIGLVASQYYNLFDITIYTQPFFQGLYEQVWMVLLPIFALVIIYYFTFNFFKKDLTLDERLHIKKNLANSNDLTWLNQFGTLGTFLKNDIKLLMRNKRAKTTLYMSFFFLFYGLIFFTQDIYKGGVMQAFAAVFVTGGFLINFGQFVPSWDSSYYQLMMTQSISYKEYLNSKWWLMIIGTAISMLLASFYIYFGWDIYITILATGIYNIGFNSFLVLLTGAYTRTAIDLESAKGAFGDKKAFNFKTLLFSLPQMIIPILLFGVGLLLDNINIGIALIAIVGLLGLLFKSRIFVLIERIYKNAKYDTIVAYKQKN